MGSGFLGKCATAAALVAVLGGCTRVIDTPQAQPEAPVAPITAGQVGELLSDKVEGLEGNLFASVDPEECSGVAREVDPPFISDHNPAATDGGHWVSEDGRAVQIEEMVGVFRADFDANAAIDSARDTIDSCRGEPFTITVMDGDQYTFELQPSVDSGSPNILTWSFTSPDWACDYVYVAAHNAAVEISACSYINGYDVLTLGQEALERIETLANTTL